MNLIASARLEINTSKNDCLFITCTFVAIASREPCLPADVIARYLDFYRRHRHFNRTNTPHLIVVWCSRLYGKKRNVWEGRGTFKNFKWEWTKGSICLRSRVFHRPCRQLAAVLLKTISIPSRDTHFLSPFFQLHLFLSLSRITSQIVSSRSEDEARGSIGAKFLLLSLKKIFSGRKQFLANILQM